MRFLKILCVVIGLGMGVSTAYAGPMLSHDATIHEFGVKRQGTVITYSFELVNVGDAPLHIDSLQPTLKLVQADVTKTVLLPREHATLTLKYDAQYGMGVVEPSIRLLSDCAVDPHMVYKLKGYIMYPAFSTRIPLGFDSASPMMQAPFRAIHRARQAIALFLGIR